jgi:pimeloyl-ACP methyl ester carboxylesterase
MSTQASESPQLQIVPSADGTPISVWVSGRGRPVILVPGAAADHAAWDRVRPFLERHFRVVAVDRRSSAGDPNERLPLEREFEDLAAVAAAFGDDFDLVGHSSGAVCAIGAAPRLRGLRRLVVYEPPLVQPDWIELSQRLDQLQASGDLDAVLETFLRQALGLTPDVVTAQRAHPSWQQRVASASCLPREAWALARWQPDPVVLSGVQSPTLLITGGDTPLSHHHRGYAPILRRALPHFETRELAGQTHFAHLQAPKQFAEVVLDFLLRDNSSD